MNGPTRTLPSLREERGTKTSRLAGDVGARRVRLPAVCPLTRPAANLSPPGKVKGSLSGSCTLDRSGRQPLTRFR